MQLGVSSRFCCALGVIAIAYGAGCPSQLGAGFACEKDGDCPDASTCFNGICDVDHDGANEGEGAAEGEGEGEPGEGEGEGEGAAGEGEGAQGEGEGEGATGEGEGEGVGGFAAADLTLTVIAGAFEETAVHAVGEPDPGAPITFFIVAEPAHGAALIGAGNPTTVVFASNDSAFAPLGDTSFQVAPVQDGIIGAAATVTVHEEILDNRAYFEHPRDIDLGGDFAGGVLSASTDASIYALNGTVLHVTPPSSFAGALPPLEVLRNNAHFTDFAVLVEPPQLDCFRVLARGLADVDGVYTLAGDHPYQTSCVSGFTMVLRSNDGKDAVFDLGAPEWDTTDPIAGDPAIAAAGAIRTDAWTHAPVHDALVLLDDDGSNTFAVELPIVDDAAALPSPSLFARLRSSLVVPAALNPTAPWTALDKAVAPKPADNALGQCVGYNLGTTTANRIRIGAVFDPNNADCGSPDSYIGFGSGTAAARTGYNYTGAPTTDDNQFRRAMVLVQSRFLTDVGDFASCDAAKLAGWRNISGATLTIAGAPAVCP